MLEADYWWRNVRQPVRFAEAMANSSSRLPSLRRNRTGMQSCSATSRRMPEGRQCARPGAALPAWDDDGIQRLQEAVLCIHLLAEIPRLDVLFPRARSPCPLAQLSLAARTSLALRYQRKSSRPRGIVASTLARLASCQTDFALENILDPDIAVAGRSPGRGAIVLPGAAYAEMALAAAHEWHEAKLLALEELADILSPIVFDGERSRTYVSVLIRGMAVSRSEPAASFC